MSSKLVISEKGSTSWEKESSGLMAYLTGFSAAATVSLDKLKSLTASFRGGFSYASSYPESGTWDSYVSSSTTVTIRKNNASGDVIKTGSSSYNYNGGTDGSLSLTSDEINELKKTISTIYISASCSSAQGNRYATTYSSSEVDYSHSVSPYAAVTAVEYDALPMTFNNTTLYSLKYGTTSITSLIYDGTTIFS